MNAARTMFVDLQIGDVLTFRNADGSEVTITVLQKHGRRSRLSLRVPDQIRVEHPGKESEKIRSAA